jgi:hypothetical protein
MLYGDSTWSEHSVAAYSPQEPNGDEVSVSGLMDQELIISQVISQEFSVTQSIDQVFAVSGFIDTGVGFNLELDTNFTSTLI